MSEADLCRTFAAEATAQGWDVWPEVAGWDLLLVRCGFQVAVEAKLKLGLGALAAAAGRCAGYDGRDNVPHAAALLVPRSSQNFRAVAQYLGLAVYVLGGRYIYPPPCRWDGTGLPLPAVRCDGPGGLPSPKVVSRWRVAAIRLCLRLEAVGHLSRADFQREGVESQRWLDALWLVRNGTGDDGRARYVAGPCLHQTGPCVRYEAERDALREGVR